MFRNRPEPVPNDVQQQLHREAAQKKHVKVVKYPPKRRWNVVFIRQAPVELRLRNSENEILQTSAGFQNLS